MAAFNFFYCDDWGQDRENFGRWITDAMDDLLANFGMKANGTIVHKLKNSWREVATSTEQFDLFFVDIIEQSSGLQLGYEVARKIRDLPDYKDGVILAITRGGQKEVTEREVRLAGMNGYIPKGEIERAKDGGIHLLQEYIKAGMGPKWTELVAQNVPQVKYDPVDLLAAAAVERVSKPDLSFLAMQALGQGMPSSLSCEYVAAGLSGAEVLRMRIGRGPGQTPKDFLIKVSRDQGALAKELKKRKEAEDFFPADLFVRFRGSEDRPLQSGGWFAIVADFQSGATSLLGWTLRVTEANLVGNTLQRLFLDEVDGLRFTYSNTRTAWDERVVGGPPSEDASPWSALVLDRKARIALATHELESLVDKASSYAAWYNSMLIDQLLRFTKVGNIAENELHARLRGKGWQCLNHGDLHSGNILVKERGDAKLIDPANIDRLHWAADVSRLVVDLIVSGLDHGKQSYEWKMVPNWCSFVEGFLSDPDFSADSVVDRDGNVRLAISWLRQRAYAIHGLEKTRSELEWEFLIALAVEFLRASYRRLELTAPKRLLGLLSACRALRLAEEAFRR